MILENENPGTLAGARRVDVTMLDGKDAYSELSAEALDLQVRLLLQRYAMSAALARAVCRISFSSRRPA